MDESKVDELKAIEETKSDAELISIIECCIDEGINTKMKLAREVAHRSNLSRQNAITLIEKYIDEKWKNTVGPRGAQMFELMSKSDERPA